MFQSKFTKCAILLGILLVLSISPSHASGVPLIPEDNVTVRCTTFNEEVVIGYPPGKISVVFRGNLISENSIEQLTLVIPSSSENFDISSIEILRSHTYEGEISAEQLESERHFENYYLHKFCLLFNPPFREIGIVIIYNTVLKDWINEDTMYLHVPIWSPKIMLENHGSIVVSGPRVEEFRLSSAATTIGGISPEYSDFYRTLSFTLESSQLVDFQRTYFWISAAYTPPLLSPRAIWDQYQKIEEMYERTNQLLQDIKTVLQETRTALYVSFLGISMTLLGIVIVIKRKWLMFKWKRASTDLIVKEKIKKKKAKVGSLSKMKKRLGNLTPNHLIVFGVFILLVGAVFFYFAEQSVLNYPQSRLHKSVSIFGQLIIVMANPLLVLASLFFY